MSDESTTRGTLAENPWGETWEVFGDPDDLDVRDQNGAAFHLVVGPDTARLISAAPELYRACTAMVLAMSDGVCPNCRFPWHGEDHHKCPMYKASMLAKAALEKAVRRG